MIRKTAYRSLYREIIRAALADAWRERRLWVLAIFAGALQTGGMYDVLIAGMGQIVQQGRFFVTSSQQGMLPSAFLHSQLDLLSQVGVWQGIIYASILVASLMGLSVIAQGALVYGLGARVRGRSQSLRECVTAGARAFWHLAGLNVVTLGLLWVAKWLVTIPLAMTVEHASFLSIGLFLIAAFVFVAATIFLTAIHMFALGGIMLDGEPLTEAISGAFAVFKKSWIVTLETAGLLFLMGVGILAATLIAFIVTMFPLFLLLVSAALLDFSTLLIVVRTALIGLFFLSMILAGAFTIQFQYGAWTALFRRVDNLNHRAIYHRVFRWLFGNA